jgi:hypothetical protein
MTIVNVVLVLGQQQSPPLQLEVLLLCLGLLALAGGAGYMAFRYRRSRQVMFDGEDEAPTEVVLDRGWDAPHAILFADEDYRNAPAQIELYSGGKTTIGRNSHECSVQINDIGISRRHAMIVSRQGRFYLRDSGSRGGTFLYRKHAAPNERKDRARLSAREERLLSDGDIVKFYTFVYRFQEGEVTVVHDDHETVYGTQPGMRAHGAPEPAETDENDRENDREGGQEGSHGGGRGGSRESDHGSAHGGGHGRGPGRDSWQEAPHGR